MCQKEENITEQTSLEKCRHVKVRSIERSTNAISVAGMQVVQEEASVRKESRALTESFLQF